MCVCVCLLCGVCTESCITDTRTDTIREQQLKRTMRVKLIVYLCTCVGVGSGERWEGMGLGN